MTIVYCRQYTQDIKEKTDSAFVQLMELINHEFHYYIRQTIHGAYDKFISQFVDETDLKEAVYDFVIQHRDSPHFDDFCSHKHMLDEMMSIGSLVEIMEYYNQLPIEKYPSWCIAHLQTTKKNVKKDVVDYKVFVLMNTLDMDYVFHIKRHIVKLIKKTIA
jgi:hypothetical protein